MTYAEERLDLHGRLRKQAGGRSPVDALRLNGPSLRFHLGTSFADLRVPVHVHATIEQAFRAAVRDLFFLLCIRHRAALRESEYDRLLLLDGFDPRGARPPSFGAPASVTREGVRRAFLEAPELHPLLDSGIVASWITAGRPGRLFVGAVNALLRRAAEEGAQGEAKEPAPYIVLLALRRLAERTGDATRDLPVSGPMGRTLSGAVATGLLIALRLAVRESGILSGPSALLCEAATLAHPWFAGLRQFWGSGAQTSGLAHTEAVPRLDQLAQKSLSAAADAVAADALADATSSKEAKRKTARTVGLAKLRGELLQLLRLAEASRANLPQLDAGATIAQLFQTPGALERIVSASAGRKELAARAKAAVKAAGSGEMKALLESIWLAAREWSDEDPGDYVSADAVAKAWGVAASALAVDAAVERALLGAEAQLVHRAGAESEGGIDEQHAAGKLYLFALEATGPGRGGAMPILLQRARAQQMGHLFCDMKDFTKRTAFLKETVVADFLSREFYGPILTAAARHAHGAAHLADKGGIYLNNLLGDAVSFSGDVVSLVELAQDIRSALASYARRLESEASSDSMAQIIASIEKKYAAEREQNAQAMRRAQDALANGTLDPLSGEEPAQRIALLQAAQQQLDDQRETELSRASGEKLEAGIFLSYGAAPEVALFDDHVFGHIKVSIAEKINESARGTARNGGVRARVEALLAQERKRIGKADLVCPLSVAVSQPLSVPVPAETELAVRAAIAAGDVRAAQTALGGVLRDYVGTLAEAAQERGDIYNGGAAISEEALQAYVEARSGELTFLRRRVPVGSLHAAIRERFVFPKPALDLILAVAPSAGGLQELYVHVGRALFKGFERQGGLGIYEIVSRDNRFFQLLAEHHVARWVSEQGTGAPPWPPGQVELVEIESEA